jgi:hypothetical protein
MMASAIILIFFLRALMTIVFWFLLLPWIANGLWSKPQADQLNYFRSTHNPSTATKRKNTKKDEKHKKTKLRDNEAVKV